MKPRIFISSTFYDLKYIREDLANFVRSYGYEPILFEDGDIGYTPGKTLDYSCYESMRNSDMVILVIGGEYGSAASGEKKEGFKEYMSVTRNEFRTAVESGIPIFVMIDKKVMVEYGVYEENYNAIEKENMKMTFPTTKNINVFRFIKEIKGIVTLPIQEFERSSDIKGFISKQWADMFKNYLTSIKKDNKNMENFNIIDLDEVKQLRKKLNDIFSYCELITQSFIMQIEDESVLENLGACKNMITEFVYMLKRTHIEDTWKNFLDPESDDDINHFKYFESNQFRIAGILGIYNTIGEKYMFLFDDKIIKLIVNILSTNAYFYKLISAK